MHQAGPIVRHRAMRLTNLEARIRFNELLTVAVTRSRQVLTVSFRVKEASDSIAYLVDSHRLLSLEARIADPNTVLSHLLRKVIVEEHLTRRRTPWRSLRSPRRVTQPIGLHNGEHVGYLHLRVEVRWQRHELVSSAVQALILGRQLIHDTAARTTKSVPQLNKAGSTGD